MLIYHILHRDEWEAAQRDGECRAESLAAQGFIHCSLREQISGVAARFYRDQTGLLLMSIETERLAARLVYENLEGGQELFPHIYGAVPLAAVERVEAFPPRPDGGFDFPLES